MIAQFSFRVQSRKLLVVDLSRVFDDTPSCSTNLGDLVSSRQPTGQRREITTWTKTVRAQEDGVENRFSVFEPLFARLPLAKEKRAEDDENISKN